MKKSFARFIIVGGLILAGAGYLLFSSMNSSMVYYYTVDEVLQGSDDFSGRGVRINGWVKPGSVSLADDGRGVLFEAFNKDSGSSMQIKYSGIVPDTFKEDSEVVVEGLWDRDQQEFTASVLLAKCPSKYESRGDAHPEGLSTGKDSPAE